MGSKVRICSMFSGATMVKAMAVVLPLFTLSAVGCRDGSKGSAAKAIIGADDRTEIRDSGIRSRLGLLNVGDHSCNATLIGPDLVVTVVHCVDSTKLGNVDGFTFSSANGKIARVQKLISADTKKDLAVYKLDTGSFEHFTPSLKSAVDQRITVAGYDTTRGKWLQSSCSIKSKAADSASFTYQCDTVPGMSGSAVLSNGEVIGLHVAHDPKLNQNLGIDFASLSSPTADLANRPQINLEWPPCICCHGCDVPKLPSLDDLKDGMMNQLRDLATPAVVNEAKGKGWTINECRNAAVGMVVAVTTPAHAAICSSALIASAGLGLPACISWIAGSTATVVGVACKQACVDGHLTGSCDLL